MPSNSALQLHIIRDRLKLLNCYNNMGKESNLRLSAAALLQVTSI